MNSAAAKGASSVTFRDFMESALYGEGGFYGRRAPKEDFYTAPELHPVFGETLAGEILTRLDDLERGGAARPFSIVEMGSGSGLLAEQIIGALRRDHPGRVQGVRYVLVERERKLLVSSVLRLSELGMRISGASDVSELPPTAGVFFSNELVDALPFHLLERRGDKVHEVYVGSDGATVLGELSTPELEAYARSLPEAAQGLRHAVSLEALRWLRAVARGMTAGCLITVDYGARMPPCALNPPRAYSKHAEDDRLTAPGRDLTANVDFETLIQEGAKLGLEMESFSTLGRFLLDRIGSSSPIRPGRSPGLDRAVTPAPAPGAQAAADAISLLRIKTLIHPDGMGETHKVLIQRKETATSPLRLLALPVGEGK
ncbi:MAG: SAM-dependent methyltransferase [Elusimicrobia bacterium]|nr:SAM-dependent methyltransferase [Elusimicrobiota bacterium]